MNGGDFARERKSISNFAGIKLLREQALVRKGVGKVTSSRKEWLFKRSNIL
jgi:hypothetical protein